MNTVLGLRRLQELAEAAADTSGRPAAGHGLDAIVTGYVQLGRYATVGEAHQCRGTADMIAIWGGGSVMRVRGDVTAVPAERKQVAAGLSMA